MYKKNLLFVFIFLLNILLFFGVNGMDKNTIDKKTDKKIIVEKKIDKKNIVEKPKQEDKKNLDNKNNDKKNNDEKIIVEKSIDKKNIVEKPDDDKSLDDKPNKEDKKTDENKIYDKYENVDYLVKSGILKDKSDSGENYKFDSNITREEILKIVFKLAGKEVPNTCEKVFKDIKKDHWGCKYAELAVKNNYIKKTENFRPKDKVTKMEALKMLMKAKDIDIEKTGDWKEGYIKEAQDLGYIDDFTDYGVFATREFIFSLGANILRKDIEYNTKTPLGNDYFKYRNKIYYKDTLIEGLDKKTFKLINSDFSDGYASDKNNIYFKGIKLEGVDRDSFEIIFNYAKDKKYVYYNAKIMYGIDIKTFEYLTYGYARDKNNVYCMGKKIKGLNPPDFQYIDDWYTKDNNNIYYENRRIEGVLKDSFQLYPKILENGEKLAIQYHAHDKNNVYYKGKKIELADVNTFMVVDENSGKDDKNIFYRGEIK